jgi:hypothetical protein
VCCGLTPSPSSALLQVLLLQCTSLLQSVLLADAMPFISAAG